MEKKDLYQISREYIRPGTLIKIEIVKKEALTNSFGYSLTDGGLDHGYIPIKESRPIFLYVIYTPRIIKRRNLDLFYRYNFNAVHEGHSVWYSYGRLFAITLRDEGFKYDRLKCSFITKNGEKFTMNSETTIPSIYGSR